MYKQVERKLLRNIKLQECRVLYKREGMGKYFVDRKEGFRGFRVRTVGFYCVLSWRGRERWFIMAHRPVRCVFMEWRYLYYNSSLWHCNIHTSCRSESSFISSVHLDISSVNS